MNRDASKRRLGRPSVLTALSTLLLAGCEMPGRPDPASRPVPANQVVAFDALYAQHCAGCHGADGRLGPAPPLNDALFLAIVPETTLREVIEQGRPGTPMPGFAESSGGRLTGAQIQALVEGIRSRWKSNAPNASEVPPYLAPKGATAPQDGGQDALRRGAQAFETACSGCHGKHGEGGEKEHEAGAINDRAFLALISDQALRRYVITGRPDLGMPDYAASKDRPDDYTPLSNQEVADIVALLASWRSGGPSPEVREIAEETGPNRSKDP